MTHICEVNCEDFKGGGSYEISPRTIVQGPHGSGKTRLGEAIKFALSGRIPGAGKTNEALLRFFGPKGGEVEVKLSDGRWLRRGFLERTRTLDSSEQTENGDVDVSAFEISDVLLDLSEFLSRSPEKKREYILRLLGTTSEWDGREVMEAIADAYARELNPMATKDHLASDLKMLPADVQDLAKCWWGGETAGICDSLMTHLVVSDPLSKLLSRLMDAAKKYRRECHGVVKSAKETVKSLSSSLKGAEAAESILAEAGEKQKACQAALTLAVRAEAEASQAQEGDELSAVQSELKTLERNLENCEKGLEQLRAARAKQQHLTGDLNQHRQSPMGELVKWVEQLDRELTDEHEAWSKIKFYVGYLSESHRVREKELVSELAQATRYLELNEEAGAIMRESAEKFREAISQKRSEIDKVVVARRSERTREREEAQAALDAANKALHEAETAAGGLREYKRAEEKVASHQLYYDAWGVCIKALGKVREELVIDAAGPVIERANTILEAGGRPERVYLELETSTGRPGWELGWVSGADRRAFEALSGAETVLVATALSCALATFVEGRKILLVEAAEIHADLETLLQALSGAEDLENIVVFTASPEIPEPAGWSLVKLGEEVSVE